MKKMNDFFHKVLETVFGEYFPTTLVIVTVLILLSVGYSIYFNGGC